jgi:hypothetical protein
MPRKIFNRYKDSGLGCPQLRKGLCRTPYGISTVVVCAALTMIPVLTGLKVTTGSA